MRFFHQNLLRTKVAFKGLIGKDYLHTMYIHCIHPAKTGYKQKNIPVQCMYTSLKYHDIYIYKHINIQGRPTCTCMLHVIHIHAHAFMLTRSKGGSVSCSFTLHFSVVILSGRDAMQQDLSRNFQTQTDLPTAAAMQVLASYMCINMCTK